MNIQQNTLTTQLLNCADTLQEPHKTLLQLAVAKYPQFAPKELIDDLTNHENTHVRANLAKTVGLNPKTLDQLAHSKAHEVDSWIVLTAVGKNQKTSPKTLATLSQQYDWAIRAAVAENPATPVQIIETIYENADITLIAALLANQSTPENILQKIFFRFYPDQGVTKLVLTHPNCTEILRNTIEKQHKLDNRGQPSLFAALNPGCNPNKLHELVDSKKAEIRDAAMQNPNLTEKTILYCINQKTELENTALILNPSLTAEHLHLLAQKNKQWQNLLKIIEHPNVDPKTVTNIAYSYTEASIVDAAAEHKLPNPNLTLLRIQTLKNENPEYILTNISANILAELINTTRQITTNKKLTSEKFTEIYWHALNLSVSEQTPEWLNTILQPLFEHTINYLLNQQHIALTTAQKITLQKLAAEHGWTGTTARRSAKPVTVQPKNKTTKTPITIKFTP